MHKARSHTILQSVLLLILVLIVIPGWMGIKSVQAGKDTNWDLMNYHFYNGYAFLHDRMDVDIAPAQQQTYFNPIMDVPLYWLYTNLPSKYVGFLYGALHGLNLSLILLIFYRITVNQSRLLKILGGAVVAIVAGTAPGFLAELGGSMNDNFVSLFTLAAIFLIMVSVQFLSEDKKRTGYWLLGIAGFVMGIIIGGKLTAALFAVSLGLMLPVLFPSFRTKWAALGIFILGGAAGFIVSDGFWLVNMWQRYGNPLFPSYNNIFHSPYASSRTFLDSRFLPANFREAVFWPFLMSSDSFRVSELKFEDIRFEILYIGLLFWALTAIAKQLYWGVRHKKPEPANLLFTRREGNFLIGFGILAFVLWMLQFSIYRYIVVLELLTPLLFLLILDRIFSVKIMIPILAVIAIIIGEQFYQPYNWGRTEWSDRYIQVDQTQVGEVRDANVIMLGNSPMSYVIPFFSPDVRFLRPENAFMHYDSGLNDEITRILHSSEAPIYVLYNANDTTVNLTASSNKLGLDFSRLDCQILQDNMPDELQFCRVLKQE